MLRESRRGLAIVLLVAAFVMPADLQAWDPGGSLIHDYGSDIVTIGDGEGGAYVAWTDDRPDHRWRAWCQRIDGNGDALWPAGGVQVSPEEPSGAYGIRLALADDGGVFVSWTQQFGLHVQRLSPGGAPAWTAPVNLWIDDSTLQRDQELLTDGSNGVVIAYREFAPSVGSTEYRITAQRLGDDGSRLWGGTGVSIRVCEALPSGPGLVAIAAGAWAVAWTENGVFAQYLNLDGELLREGADIPFGFASSGLQETPLPVADDSGGCFVFWRDHRGAAPALYGQHFDAPGVGQWAADGLPVSGSEGAAVGVAAIADGAGGTILAWGADQEDADLFAQRIAADGEKLWSDPPRPVVSTGAVQSAPHLIQDDAGGAYLTWNDSRRGCGDIFGQRLSSTGSSLWTTTGVPVAVLDGNQTQKGLLAAGEDEFIAVWQSFTEPFVGIYGIRIGSGGSGFITDCTPPPTSTPPQRSSLRPLQASPNPFNPRTTISFELGEAGPVRLEVYDLRGRVVARLLDEWMTEGPQGVVWEGRSDRGGGLPSGVYFLRLEQRGWVQTMKVALVQ